MNILVVNGAYIQMNSSANLCHLAYIRGLIDAGHRVTLLSADGRDQPADSGLKIPDEVVQHTYYGVSLYEKLSYLKRSGQAETRPAAAANDSPVCGSVRKRLFTKAKRSVLALYGVHGVYAKFVQKAKRFRSDDEYDFVLSLSTPVTSHLLAHKLLRAGHIRARHWIQIWEDPWYSDAYGFNGKDKVYREEKRLLSFAERVCYVSPLTLKNQQKLFPEYAEKMYWQPLPYYYAQKRIHRTFETDVYGYFGDYSPAARNLEPFYTAAKNAGIEVNICGNPSSLFPPTDNIHVHARLPLKELAPIEDATNILVFLCNRGGGQIPGKIYQYSGTNKTILFILDGTEDEKTALREYFEPFNRYVFCDNTQESIFDAIQRIQRGELGEIQNEPVAWFEPEATVRRILEGECPCSLKT